MGKQVVRVSVLAVLISYFPGFGGMMKKAAESMKAAHAKPEPDSLVLADETSAWRSEVYLEVTREVSDLLSHRISATFAVRILKILIKILENGMQEFEMVAKKKKIRRKELLLTTPLSENMRRSTAEIMSSYSRRPMTAPKVRASAVI